MESGVPVTSPEGPTTGFRSLLPLARSHRLATLTIASLLVRLVTSLTFAVVATDGSRDLKMAKLMLEGRFHDALVIYPLTHPLHPLLTALLHVFLGDMLVAGVAVSVLLGGLAVIPLFLMARRAWDEKTATLAAVLYIFLPAVVELQSDAMTEATLMFFFFASMALGWSAVEKKSWEHATLAGACAALAWLARPEGIYLVPLFLLACVLRPSRFSLAALGCFLAAGLVLAFPYLTFIKLETGHWGMSANPFSKGILGLFTGETPIVGYSVNARGAEEFEEYRDIWKYGKFLGPVITVARTVFFKNLFYVFGPFLVIGFGSLRPKGASWPPILYQGAGAVGYFIPPILAFLAATPFSHRYILVSIILVLPVVARGLLKAAEWVQRRNALPLFLGLACLVMAVRDFRPKRLSKIGAKQAGVEILRRLGPGQRILTTEQTIEYYSRGEYFTLEPGTTYDQLEKFVETHEIDVIAFYVPSLRNLEDGMDEKVAKRYERLGEFPAHPKAGDALVRVYVIKPR